jgi:hypothetical protein
LTREKRVWRTFDAFHFFKGQGFTMETLKKTQFVVVDDQPYRVEGYGQEMEDGCFQSVCKIVTKQGEDTLTQRLAFQIFTKDRGLAAEVALLCGANTVSKERSAVSVDR